MDPERSVTGPGASGLIIGLFIAISVLVIILALNWLGDGIKPISEDDWHRLVARRAISRIELQGERVVAELGGVSQGDERDDKAIDPDLVLLPRPASAITEAEQARWREAGIEVVAVAGEDTDGQPTAGLLLIAALLALGGWYLWDQIRLDRQGPGSPRRRMAALERDLQEGRIPPEEFQRRAEEISAEM
ncbi:MAG: hypothetical protein WDA75_09045 [Candidatus Latescibacterota bacterium]|jgi:hypothetical protein